jgi:hypothetical protein
MVLPQGATGAGAARDHVHTICVEQGYPYVWILDDDISSVEKGNGEQSTLRALFSSMERWIEDYSNVALLGVNIGQSETGSPYIVNEAVRGLMLVNLQTRGGFNSSYKLYEDYEFALQHLANGYVTVVHNDFHLSFAQIPGGGASGFYIDSDDAKALNEIYPEHTELVYRSKSVPPEVTVDWKKFPTSLRSRHVELLMKGE